MSGISGLATFRLFSTHDPSRPVEFEGLVADDPHPLRVLQPGVAEEARAGRARRSAPRRAAAAAAGRGRGRGRARRRRRAAASRYAGEPHRPDRQLPLRASPGTVWTAGSRVVSHAGRGSGAAQPAGARRTARTSTSPAVAPASAACRTRRRSTVACRSRSSARTHPPSHAAGRVGVPQRVQPADGRLGRVRRRCRRSAGASSGQRACRSGRVERPVEREELRSPAPSRRTFHSLGGFDLDRRGRRRRRRPSPRAVGFARCLRLRRRAGGAVGASSSSPSAACPVAVVAASASAGRSSVQTKWSKSNRVASIHAASGSCFVLDDVIDPVLQRAERVVRQRSPA